MQVTSALIWSDETKTRFAALVREVLKRERISQEAMAKQIGVTQGTISLWTKGAIKSTPSQAALMSFANFCEMTLDELSIQLGLTRRRTFDLREIKAAIGQADLREAWEIHETVTKRLKAVCVDIERSIGVESIGKSIKQYMITTGATEAEIAAELKKRGFRDTEKRLREILNGDLAYKDELRAIALFLWGDKAKQDQILRTFGVKKPALTPDQATLNGDSN